jgi:RNA polymerase sigma-70 factor (ECF subfamily)
MGFAIQSDEESCLDITLIERIVRRDQSAVAELYDRHNRLLYGLILRIVRDRSEAEDVLQEVFVAVWNRAETYNGALGCPAAWLVRVARNRAIDRMRSSTVRQRTLDTVSAAEPPATESPEATAALGEMQVAVKNALARLPPDQRLLIQEAYFLGLTQSELSDRHRLPLGTVKTRMRTGLAALRQQLSQTFGEQ